jgi:hypothetical protein
MSRINKLTPKLRKSPQPPLSQRGTTADSDRAKRPLAEPSATGETESRRSRRRFGQLRNADLGVGYSLNRRTKRTQSSSGMMTAASDSTVRGLRKCRP